MNTVDMNLINENQIIRREFEQLGLDPEEICRTEGADPQQQSRVLRSLLHWVHAYRSCPDRAKLAEQGYEFPPVFPCMDPDTDWLLFERWMQGKPLRWRYEQTFGPLHPPDLLTDCQAEAELAKVVALLATRNVQFDVDRRAPARGAYAYLCRALAHTEFDFLPPNATWHLTACDGDCEDCFQRRYCDVLEAPEDEERSRIDREVMLGRHTDGG